MFATSVQEGEAEREGEAVAVAQGEVSRVHAGMGCWA